MPHIHTEIGEHDATVTAYIVRIDTPEPRALVHMHRKLHKLLSVGGHVERNENPWQALAHEIEEESGYTLDQLNIFQPMSRITHLSKVVQHPYPLSMNTHDITPEHFHSDIQYGFTTSSEPSKPASEGESMDLRWLTQNELNQLDESQIYTNTKEIYNFIFDHAMTSWEQIPATHFALTLPDESLKRGE